MIQFHDVGIDLSGRQLMAEIFDEYVAQFQEGENHKGLLQISRNLILNQLLQAVLRKHKTLDQLG